MKQSKKRIVKRRLDKNAGEGAKVLKGRLEAPRDYVVKPTKVINPKSCPGVADHIFRFYALVLLILIVSLVTMCQQVSASEHSTGGEYRIGVMPRSTHFSSRGGGKEYNETHKGVLGEIRIREDVWVGFMNFDNSFNDNSNTIYAGVTIEDYEYFDLGYQWGLVSGYELDPSPYAMFTVTFKVGNHFRPRIGGIPGMVMGYQYIVEW